MSVVWEGPEGESLHLELADDHVEVIVRAGDGVLFQHAHVRVPVAVFWDWLDSAMDLLPKGTSADLPPLDALALLHQSLAVPEARTNPWLGGVGDGVALSVAVVSGVPGDTLLVGSEVIRSGAEIARARVLAMEAERGAR